jgi:hypothetical protein
LLDNFTAPRFGVELPFIIEAAKNLEKPALEHPG